MANSDSLVDVVRMFGHVPSAVTVVQDWLLIVAAARLTVRRGLERFDAPRPPVRPVDDTASLMRVMGYLRLAGRWGGLIVLLGVLGLARSGHTMLAVLLAVFVGSLALFFAQLPNNPFAGRRRLEGPGDIVVRALCVLLDVGAVGITMLVPLAWAAVGPGYRSGSFGLTVAAGFALGWLVDCGVRQIRNRPGPTGRPARYLYLRDPGDRASLPAEGFGPRSLWRALFGFLVPRPSVRLDMFLIRVLSWEGSVRVAKYSGSMPQRDEAVVLSATPVTAGPELDRRLEALARDIPHGRIILVFGSGSRTGLHWGFASFVRAARPHPLFLAVTKCDLSDGTLVMVHVPSPGGGSWHGWGAEVRTARTYTAALGEALAFARKSWDEPGAEYSEVVLRALNTAAERASNGIVGTRDLLLALMEADSTSDWSRLGLHNVTPEALRRATVDDPGPPSMTRWAEVLLTEACAKALRYSLTIASEHGLLPVPAGVLALALIEDRDASAARALDLSDPGRHRHLSDLIQDDLLAIRLTDPPEPEAA